MPCWLSVRTGAFPDSAPGAYRSPCLCTGETGELHPRTGELIEAVAQRIAADGIDAWFELEPESLLGEDAQMYDKVTDTLDVWFDSGVTHACVCGSGMPCRRPPISISRGRINTGVGSSRPC